MAAGIAHEINNPLAGILLYSTNMVKKVPEGSPLKEGLQVITRETTRCKGIIQELLEFSRGTEPKKMRHNINRVIEKALSVLDNEFRLRHIRVELRLGTINDSLLDENQMEQVFVNIMLNAAEAIEEKGQITISSYMNPAGKVIIVCIQDTGCGIAAENLPKLFEPFFSTKSKGTGLGLAVSYGIVRNHGGNIQVSSTPGKGTCFTIELPVQDAEKPGSSKEDRIGSAEASHHR
jgi:signal transduction histidine kinase